MTHCAGWLHALPFPGSGSAGDCENAQVRKCDTRSMDLMLWGAHSVLLGTQALLPTRIVEENRGPKQRRVSIFNMPKTNSMLKDNEE